MLSICSLSNTYFLNHYGKSNGGVISVQDVILEVYCCTFQNNSSPDNGGCIYCEDTTLTIKRSSFFRCCSTRYQNNIWGNAIYCLRNEATLDNYNVVLCSYANTPSSDSSLSFNNAQVTSSYLNSTGNFGFGGGSAFTFQYIKDNSYVKNSLLIDGRDHRIIETVSCTITVNKTDFINCSNCQDCILYTEFGAYFYLNECIFYNNGNKAFSNSNAYKLYKCQMDKPMTGMTLIYEQKSNNNQFDCHCKLLELCQSNYNSYLIPSILKMKYFTLLII